MNAKNLRDLSEKELQEKLVEFKKELIKHYAQVSTGTIPKSPAKIKQARKNVARINTILTSKGGQK